MYLKHGLPEKKPRIARSLLHDNKHLVALYSMLAYQTDQAY